MKKINEKIIILVTIILLLIQIICELNRVIVFSQIIRPVIWLLFSVYLIIRKKNTYFRFKEINKNFEKMLIVTAFYYIFYFSIGFVFGFVKSPYSHNILIMFKNIINALIPVLGIELVRSFVVNGNKDKNKIIVVIITILLMMVEINYNILLSHFSTDKESTFKYIAQVLMPLIASSCLYTYLTSIGGEKLPLVYRVASILVLYILPIYPDMDWFLESCLGLIIPTIYYLLFKYVFSRKNETVRTFRRKNKIGLSLSLIIVILLVSFMLGLFKYEPVAIVSNSMKPTYLRGDVVIYEKESTDDLKKLEKNSIILYRIDNQMVAHRVVNVIQDNGIVKFQTKGDNNNAPDSDYVDIDQIVGVYKMHIKYIGYPSVWLNDFFNNQEAKVETK